METIWEQFLTGLMQTSALEFIAVITGIASVLYSRNENILLYPVGLISTTIFIYLSVKGHLYGEASVNLYYTIMSIYGWWLWAKKTPDHRPELSITRSNRRDWLNQILFFLFFYAVLFVSLTWLKKEFAPEAIPWADAFASASAYTGMWLMARKKVESWYWWIITDIASVPLYYSKGYVFTGFQFVILTLLAISGLQSWKRKSQSSKLPT
ncbi:nicotinamide riboside transporter PnuC [Flavihumibacter cheonanensis]|jgi:nicotinamide mononucleotide transporter|uniref:nicotinamide riboside transporter PnuC n=1 Tax=Flavihumibacter cheonanensis TaxID=1442385 RepID=UPI001EF78C50|nr:nicotinamide riboside transporter PnuC [Flavihumibacter cheonanensis]MCG7752959.1 nicotinamide riboside transporter PnuC [Flavihumibacter cheonanensis]